MTSLRHACLLIIAGSTGVGAIAQPVETSIEQISANPRGVEMPLNPPNLPRSGAAPPQLVSGPESAPVSVQVAPEARSIAPTDQLSTPGKTAQPPQPLSQPVQGRRTAVERLTGADRCDPVEPRLPTSKCVKVIENRSSEFARPDPNALSPEQRLLLEQEVREGALDAESGARRLAVTGEADESLAAMGVAASVLRPKEEVPEKTRAQEDLAKAAEIVATMINQPVAEAPPQ